MICPQDTETTVCNRHHAISLLFANDPHLIHRFFTEDRQALRWDGIEVASQLARTEVGDQEAILMGLALDLWLECGNARLHDAYRHLTSDRFNGLIMAMELLFAAGGCDCQNCRQRFWMRPASWMPFSQ